MGDNIKNNFDLDSLYNEAPESTTPTEGALPLQSSDLDTMYETTPGVVPTTGTRIPGFEYDRARRLVKGAIDPVHTNLEDIYAQNQSGLEQFGSMLNQAILGEVVGGTIEGIGYLFDLEDTYNALINGQTEVGNILSDVGASLKEWTREATPIYENFQPGQFRPDKWSWWMSNMPSVASTLSLMIPSGAAVKGLSSLARGFGVGAKMGKTSKVLTKGITQAVISRQMESMMEASEVQKSTLDSLLSQGIDYNTALEESSKAAAYTYKADWATLAQDIYQYTTMIKPFGSATRALTVKSARRLGKDVTPIIMNKTASVTKNMLGEAAEEGYQYIVGERAREIAEYNAGLRPKTSLSDTVKESLGEGNFWTSAFFGALGAGFVQTAGRSLNMARERIRGLENAEERRLRDIDTWGQSIRGLGAIDEMGESVGNPDINSKDQQIANLGLRLSRNGNLNWFLDVMDSFQNMSEEDQQMFNFTSEDIQAAREQFPNLRSDLEKIGEYYDAASNTGYLNPASTAMITYEQFMADKKLERYRELDNDYNNRINNISGLSIENVSENARNLIIREKVELNNLLKLRRELRKQNTSEEILNGVEERISEIRNEIKESKKQLTEKEQKEYNGFNTRSMDFRRASGAYLRKEFTLAEHKRALEQAEYYSNPENQKKILEDLKTTQEQAIREAVVEMESSEEIESAREQAAVAEEPEVVTEEEGEVVETINIGEEDTTQNQYPTSNLSDVIKGAVEERTEREIQEDTDKLDLAGKEKYDSLTEAAENKYENKPTLVLNDVQKILDAISSGEIYNGLTEKEREEVSNLVSNIRINIKDKTLFSLRTALTNLDIRESKSTKKLASNILDIINKEVKEAKTKEGSRKTRESIDNQGRTSVGTTTEEDNIIIRKINQLTRLIKDRTKGFDFSAVNRYKDKSAKELGVDQELVNKGNVKVNTKVYFEVDKEDNDEKSNKNNPDTRGFQIVAYVNNKRIVIGLVPADQKDLREILQKEINSKYSTKKRYIQANITSSVTGFMYKFSRSTEYGSPLEKINKKDQDHFKKYGGFVYDYVEAEGNVNKLSGKTNLPTGVYSEEAFNDSPEGSVIIPIPHPFYPSKYLYLRGHLRSLRDYRNSNAQNAEERYNAIVENVTKAFRDYINNPTAATKKAIREFIITRDINIKDNTLILSPRQKTGREYRISIENFESKENQNQLEEWIADSKLNIKKDKLNTSPEPHNIGFGVTKPIHYNTLISDFIQLSTQDGVYFSDTRVLIEEPSVEKYTVEAEKISQEEKNEERSVIEDDPDAKIVETIDLTGNTPAPQESVEDEREKQIRKEKEVLASLTEEEAKKLPDTIGNRSTKAFEVFDTINWNNKKSIVSGFAEISRIINAKKVLDHQLIDYLNTIRKLTDVKNVWSKKYIQTYIIARSKDISSLLEEKIVEKPSDKKEEKPTGKIKKPKVKNRINGSSKLINQAKENKNNKTRTKPKENRNLPKWNRKEETSWFNRNFPNIPLHVLDNLKNVIANGSEYWGVFHNASIYIEENAAEGTLYHEAFHAVFNLYTEPKQRTALLKEGASKYRINRNNFESQEEFEIAIEEAMANDFADVITIESIPKNLVQKLGKIITDFFRNLQSLIKRLYSHPIYNIDEFFWRANNGFYKKPFISPGSFSDPVTRYRPKGWTNRQEKIAVNAINGHLITSTIPSLGEENSDYSNLTDVEIINKIGLDELLKNIVIDFVELLESNTVSNEEKSNIEELLLNFYDSENDTFRELKTSVIRGLEFYDIKIKENKASKIEKSDSEEESTNDLKDAEKNAQDKKEGWQDTAIERSTKQNALKEVKNFIRNMQVPGFKNIYGLDSLVDYNETYDTLLKDLAGTTDVKDMVDYLEANLIIHPEYQQILDEFKTDPAFKTKFFSSFNKNHTKYNIVSFINGNYAVYQANRKGLANRIISEWTENILLNKKITTVDSQGNTSLNENVKPIVKNIRKEIQKTIDNWSKDVTQEYYEPLSKILSELGIDINTKVLHYIGSIDNSRYNGKGSLTAFFLKGDGNFSYLLNKFEDLKNPFDAEGGLSSGESNAIRNAANMVAKASTELYESSFRNISGKTVYAHLEQNFLSKLTHRFQNPNRKEQALKPYTKDQLFYHIIGDEKIFHNRILKDIQEKDQILFDVQVTEGLTDDKNNRIPYQKLDSTGLKLYSIHNYFNNNSTKDAWYRATVLSDAPNGIVFRHRKESKDKVLGSLALLAEAEYNRILSIRNQLKNLPENLRVKNYHNIDNADLKTGYHIIQGMRGHKGNNYENNIKIIDKWLSKKADNYFKSLVDSGMIIIKSGEVYPESRLDRRIIEKYNTESSLKDFITEFYYNDFLSRAEFSLITVGDPAFYKPSSVENNKTVDYIKRAKEIYSPKSILDISAEEVGYSYKTVYLGDNEIQSPSFDSISDAINNLVSKKIITKQSGESIIKSYSRNINQTDAQAYITLPFYRRTMIGMGKWTNKHEQAYNRLKKGKGIGKDISLMLQPLKPFAYSQVWSDKVGRLIPVQNKNSEFLLLPQLAFEKDLEGNYKNPKLANLLKFMQGANIDSVNFSSAVKAGLSKVVNSNVFDTQESTEKFIKEEYEPNAENWYHILNMEDRGIQQEVPEHFVDAENLFGTQIRKLIMSDLFYDTTYLGMTPTKLRETYEELLIADLIEAYNELENKIVVEKNEDGSPKEINYKFVYELLLDEARNRGKGEEFEKAIQYDEKKNRLTLPLHNPVTDIPAQNLITSIFKSRITKQKISGGAFVQVSSFGLSDQLKLVFNEEGGLQYGEVMLPAWSKKFFEDFINEDGDVDFEAIERNIPEVLDMVGYRIPTEDKYSMLPLRVVGFLPYTSGGAVMLPADITQISGSDFDVDKMYIMMKSFKVDRKLSKEGFEEVANQLNTSPKILGKALKKAKAEEELTEEESKLVDSYKELDKDPYLDVEYSVNEYDKSKSALKNSKQARNNYKIDIITSVLQNPHTLESILSGGTFEPLQAIANLTNIKAGKSERDLDPISLDSMDSMHIDNMTGKSMVGIAANENAFHSIAQHANLELSIPVLFDGEYLTSLSDTKAKVYIDINRNTNEVKILKGNKHSQKISKNKAYYLAAIVDNAKDPVASYINYNTYTSSVVGLLTQAGVDPATITWFLKQPVIEEITRKYFESGEDRSVENTIIEEAKKKYGIKEKTEDLKPIDLDTLDLLDNLNKDNSFFQKRVLQSFLVYKELAKDWTALVLASRADTSGFGPTLADAEVMLDSIEKVKDKDFSIKGAMSLFREDLISTNLVYGFTEYGINKPLDIVNLMYPYSSEFNLYREIKRKISDNVRGRDLTSRERNNINKQITAFILSGYQFFNPNERSYYINNFPKEFLELKEKDSIFADNYLIRRLEYKSKVSDKKVPIERIEFSNTGSLSNDQKNDIQNAWLDLFESEDYRDIAEKLLRYSYFTNGLGFTPNSFSHLIPIDMINDSGIRDKYNQTLGDYMYNNKDIGNELVDVFIDQFYRNNYKNKSLVPLINEDKTNVSKKIFDNKGNTKGYVVYSNVQDKSFVLGKDNFVPFISEKIGDNKFNLYQRISINMDTFNNYYAKYEIVEKLGYPNYIQEYMINSPALRSSLDFNQIGTVDILDEGTIKTTKKPAVRQVEESDEISNDKYKITGRRLSGDKTYGLDFIYDGKEYSVSVKNKNGKNIYINNKTGLEIKESSVLVKIFKSATSLRNKKNCG